MIDSLHIRNLRGIRSLDVADLGRVNVIVGRNEAGKTTVLAASGMQADPKAWLFIAPFLDDPRPAPLSFERHILPLFRGGDPSTPAQVWATRGSVATGWRLEAANGRGHLTQPLTFSADPGDGRTIVITLDDGNIRTKGAFKQEWATSWWSPACVEAELDTFHTLYDLYKAGRIAEVVAPLRHLNPDIETVDLAGQNVFVRLRGHPLPLRLGVLGDGARRLLEFAIAVASGSPTLHIDEIENGFHHSVLPVPLRMLQGAPPSTQIFCTTHRDELIRVACEVFLAANDDGLRIIRVDRAGDAHSAAVYTAAEALAGLDAGLELRG
jgi:hypothetical protein